MISAFPRWLVVSSAGICCVVGAVWSGAATVAPNEESGVQASARPAEVPPNVEVGPSLDPPVTERLTKPTPIDVNRLTDDAFDAALGGDLSGLGPIALGRPNRGYLFNGVALSEAEGLFRLEEPEFAYGTAETVAGLNAAVREVHRLFPQTRPLSVGHISRRGGGWLRPHKSHQNGRDVDLGFYYTDDSPWYRQGTAENLDVPRTWALITAMERAAGLEYVFVDRSLHGLLRQHAEDIGESPEFVRYMFDGPLPERGPTIRHARGHKTHLHVRFASPIAVESAGRLSQRAGKAGRRSAQLAQVLRQGSRRGVKPAVKRRRVAKTPRHAARSTRPRVKAL